MVVHVTSIAMSPFGKWYCSLLVCKFHRPDDAINSSYYQLITELFNICSLECRGLRLFRQVTISGRHPLGPGIQRQQRQGISVI